MVAKYVDRYADLIRTATTALIDADCTLSGRLVIERRDNLTVSYAPFDYINRSAKIVLVGITPGRRQATDALLEFRRQLLAGSDLDTAVARTKKIASFSGPLRKNLVNQLDYFGIQRLLGMESCAGLFGAQSHLVHYTSALRYPVFLSEQNYAGSPRMTDHPMLLRHFVEHFGEEVRLLRGALFVPLGMQVSTALRYLTDRGILDPSRVLDGLQHPSGANAERIAYLLRRKPRAELSRLTRGDVIDRDRSKLETKIQTLIASQSSSPFQF